MDHREGKNAETLASMEPLSQYQAKILNEKIAHWVIIVGGMNLNEACTDFLLDYMTD